MRVLLLSGVLAALCVPTQAMAEGQVSASLTGGTLGIGPELGYRLSDTFGVRGNATFLSVSHNFDSDDVTYRGKVKLKSVGMMFDLYPFGGGFRISAGARINGNAGTVRATPTEDIELNGTSYTPTQVGTLRGKAETKNFAPALTLGYGGGLRSGFTAGVEAGVLFQGKVRLRNFTASGSGVSAADLEAERMSLQSDVDDYKVYPILQLTLGYRF
ncbi:hypothetical protein ACMT1E_02375 [Sphingomonas flavalba]|uniref:hypothetical protein n=1 Tax=Sphingomonas flavalba TaxID=2559804 RepID=UPI0039DF7EE3